MIVKKCPTLVIDCKMLDLPTLVSANVLFMTFAGKINV